MANPKKTAKPASEQTAPDSTDSKIVSAGKRFYNAFKDFENGFSDDDAQALANATAELATLTE